MPPVNIKDLKGEFEVEHQPDTASSKPLNIADLKGDYEEETAPVEEGPSEFSPGELVKSGAGTVIGGGIGYGLGKAGQGVTQSVFDTIVPSLGNLNKEQLDLISSDPKAYQKASPLENILDTWKDLSSKTQKQGIQSATDARAALAGKPNVAADKIFGAFSKETADPKYSTPIDPGTKSNLFQTHYNTVKPEIDSLRGRKSEIDNLLSQLEQNKNVDVSDPTLELREKQANQAYDRKMSNPNNTNQSDLNFKKYQTDEKLDLAKSKKEQARIAKIESGIEKLNKERTSVLDGIDSKSKSAIQKARTEYSKIANIPEELDLEDRFLRPEYSSQAENAVAKVRPAKNTGIEPATLDQMLQELREGVNYDAQSSKVKDFNKGMAANVRDLLGQEVPEYDAGMKQSSALQNLQDKIEQSTGVKYDKAPDNIRFDDNARNKLGKTLLSGTANDPNFKNSREELSGIVSDLLKNGVIDQNQADTFINNGQLSALRDFVQNSNTKLGLGDVADVASPSKWVDKVAKFGTKGQAKMAELLPSVKTAMPYGGAIAGALIGGLTGVAAADEQTDAADFIPGLDQAPAAGSSFDDRSSKIENKAFQNYQNSPARQDSKFSDEQFKRKNFLERTLRETPEEFKQGFAYKQAQDELKKLENNSGTSDDDLTERSQKLNKASPDQLMELSQNFQNIKGADKFVAPLENAAQASSEEERKARLFGLYQQPAFRQLLKKHQS